MALPEPEKSDEQNLDKEIGAEFEENKPAAKVMVQDKTRVTKPEYMGDKPDEGTETEKTGLASTPKSNTLKPDISNKEATADQPVSSESHAVDELAKAAADKKSLKDSDKDSVEQDKVQNLVDNKTYFVPVGQVRKKRNAKIILGVVLALIVLGIAGYVLMSGAGQ